MRRQSRASGRAGIQTLSEDHREAFRALASGDRAMAFQKPESMVIA
jgi:hypothetical protein